MAKTTPGYQKNDYLLQRADRRSGWALMISVMCLVIAMGFVAVKTGFGASQEPAGQTQPKGSH